MFLGLQIVFRIVFLISYRGMVQDALLADQLLALLHGLKLDISLTGYILLFPTLILIPFSIFRKGFFRSILSIYTFIILLSLIMAYISNLVIYQYWNTPIDRSIFDYLSTPGEMFASISPAAIILFLSIIIFLIASIYFWIYRKWIASTLNINLKRNWLTPILFFLLVPTLILPIRGGLATSPIHVGVVYFHESSFLNHTAVNPVWNLFSSLVESGNLTQSVEFYSSQEVKEIMDDLYDPVSEPVPTPILTTRRPNIIIILLESFGQPVISDMGGKLDAAPNINSLISEGVFFNNFYSSGTMTDRSLGAVLGGYPAVPGTCIIYFEDKALKLPSLNKKLKSSGYNSAFLYGGDIDFGHISSYLVINGFEQIISDKNFPLSIKRSSWGVPDHILFEKLLEVSEQASTPFFNVLLTLSSHTPFDVPMEPVFPGNDHIEKFKNSVFYTDKYLGEFIENAKSKDWWDETIIIIMADHGCRIGNISAHEKKRFHIPMLWLGGALSVSDTTITEFSSQTDLPLTLLNQLGMSGDEFIFSKDILSPETRSFAYYTYNDGIGFISDSMFSIYSFVKGDYLLRNTSETDPGLDPGLAYIQYLFEDFNSK